MPSMACLGLLGAGIRARRKPSLAPSRTTVAPRTELLEHEQIGWLVPRRAADSHKGTYGHLVVVEVDDLLRVLDDGRGIGGDDVFVIAHADDQG